MITMTDAQIETSNKTIDWLIAVYNKQNRWLPVDTLFLCCPYRKQFNKEGFYTFVHIVKQTIIDVQKVVESKKIA